MISLTELKPGEHCRITWIPGKLGEELQDRFGIAEDRHLWEPSYFVESIGAPNEQAVAKYIDDQRKKESYDDH